MPHPIAPCPMPIAERVAARIRADAHRLRAQFAAASGVRACWLDGLLPKADFKRLSDVFPPLDDMLRRRSLKERKYVCARTEVLDVDLRELVLALSSEPVVRALSDALGYAELYADPLLYNGGVTALVTGDFTRPHLDNSHNLNGRSRRALVGLFYFAPKWTLEDGGHLSLFDTRRSPRQIDYAPNRLVFMETTETSWHSVGHVTGAGPRLNTATYYYAKAASRAEASRLTRFRDWRPSPLDALLEADFRLRDAAQRLGLRKLVKSRHVARTAA